MLRTFAILINYTWEKTMSNQNKKPLPETIDFGDGVKYKTSDMTKRQIDILQAHENLKEEKDVYIQIGYYYDKLKKDLEAVDNAETEGGEDEPSEH